ncbi:hypothetical protein C5F59_004690 [Streptomyces sp. QL37]|uniref:hypothetical protein n=1 Tax=Streptomyces sp. QL37 TaxID=2093747 RepID=UPI0021CB5ADA|nr:hypothetical protein [Streptomyces sp. QL37]
MSVSLYYCAGRATPLTVAETAAVERIVAAHMASFPYEDQESLYLYDRDDSRPDEIVAGSTKMPFDPGKVLPVLDHVLVSVTELRRALPGAEWRVRLDDLDVPWDGTGGYAFPGMRGADLAAELGGLQGPGLPSAVAVRPAAAGPSVLPPAGSGRGTVTKGEISKSTHCQECKRVG